MKKLLFIAFLITCLGGFAQRYTTSPTLHYSTPSGGGSLTTDLISVYEMQDTNASDSYGTNDGTITSVTTQSTGFAGATYSYLFDGATSYITLPTISTFGISTSSFSVSVWIKPTASKSSYIVASRGAGTVFLLEQENLEIRTSITNFTTFTPSIQVSSAIAVNGEYHIIMTYDRAAKTGKIYINGSEVGSDTFATDPLDLTTSNTLNVGRRTSNTEFFQGYMTQLAIWGRALTSTDVTALYNSGSVYSYSNW